MIWVCGWLACAGVLAQEFEVVSIKPNNSSGRDEFDGTNGARFTARAIDLRSLISRAFGVQNHQISGPDWLSSLRFDVAAKFSEDLDPRDQVKFGIAFRTMMQKMLVERFKLESHRESKVLAVYGLVVEKSGIKFQEAPVDGPHGSMNCGNGSLTGRGITVGSLAEFLSWNSELPVVDLTEVKGAYDVNLHWVPQRRQRFEPGKASDPEGGSTLDAALDEQLGLKLERRKAPMELLVIDHIEKVPTEN